METKGVNIKLLLLLLGASGGITADQVRIANNQQRIDKIEIFIQAEQDRRIEFQKLKDDVTHMNERLDEILSTLKEMQRRK